MEARSRVSWAAAAIALFIAAGVAGVPGATAQARAGPSLDKVLFALRGNEGSALKDLIEGRTDLLFSELPAFFFNKLSEADKAKLEVYTVPGLALSLLLNPVPDRAPYTLELDGITRFNPLAIKEFRFALNWLIDRAHVAEEIYGGAALPMFTMATPGQPGSYRYDLVAARLGITARGDEKRALAAMAAAMEAAAALPENRGRLAKLDRAWTFDGRPVSLAFLIRVDDPAGRLPLGRYVAEQIEKAGIKVERLERGHADCAAIAYGSDPRAYAWSLYTEAWSAGADRGYWDKVLAQMYAPYAGRMPGFGDAEAWNYEAAEIDALLRPVEEDAYLTEKDYYEALLAAARLGLEESVRVFVGASTASFVANKGRFLRRFAYGLGEGFDEWSIRSAEAKPELSGPYKGLRVLRVLGCPTPGAPSLSAWNPVGDGGFADPFSESIRGAAVDKATYETPHTGLTLKYRGVFDERKIQSKVAAEGEGRLAGGLEVPAAALAYDSAEDGWKPVGPGVKAMSAATAGYLWGFWHDGQPESLGDLVYALAFQKEWASRDGEEDRYYDEGLEALYSERLGKTKGLLWNPGAKTVSAWLDRLSPVEPARLMASFPPFQGLGDDDRYAALVPWQICEALSQLVAEGSRSGTAYTFGPSGDPSLVEVDLKLPACVADIKAKLQDFQAARYLPAPLRGLVTVGEALSRYGASIKFIEAHRHAFIGNGPFLVDRVDPASGSVELSAFRVGYPYLSDYWQKALRLNLSSIDSVEAPAAAKGSGDAVITVRASAFSYPEVSKSPLAAGRVSVTLVLPEGGEKVFEARVRAPGVFVAAIPAALLRDLEPGPYPLVIQAQIGTESPSIAAETLLLY